MSGRSIPAILDRGRDFQELGHRPLFGPSGLSSNCHGAFSLLMWAYTEAQGLVEVDLSAILDSFGSNQFVMSLGYVFLSKLCPASFPPVSLSLTLTAVFYYSHFAGEETKVYRG